MGHPFISMVYASPNSGNVYAVLDHHRFGDFKPYVYKSSNGGATWTKIVTGLPENGPVKTVIEDFKDADIVLVGTEFGLHISVNGGKQFLSWQGGMPPIAIKDMVFQERDDDFTKYVLALIDRNIGEDTESYIKTSPLLFLRSLTGFIGTLARRLFIALARACKKR